MYLIGELVNISGVSPALFISSVVFVLLIGSCLSIGTLRMFQLRKKQGLLFLGSAAVSLIVFLIVLNVWFL